MCGIGGILNFNSRPVELEEMSKLTNAMIHRGRDNTGIELGGRDRGKLSDYPGISLGHLRLSIIDLSSEADQPMYSDDNRICAVFNGEIYNYIELRDNLKVKGFTFRTQSDTEVLLKAYLHWGKDCLHHLNGMFAFAIWDEIQQSLLCARDPIGVKPFYYTYDKESFRFASESQAIIKSRGDLDRDAITSYLLSSYIPRTQSIYSSVKKLLPGHYMVVTPSGKINEEQYWSLPVSGTWRGSSHEAAELIQYQLDKAVSSQLRSDVPVGALLSGGFDSGMIIASASKSSSNLHTYSVGFDDGKQFSELAIASSLAQRYGTQHHERIIKSKDVMSILDKAIAQMSEPIADSAMVPTYCLSEMAAHDGVKVLLSGTGGDEIFAGYPKYVGYNRSRRMFNKIPSVLRHFIGENLLTSSVLGARMRYSSLDMMICTAGSPNIARQLFASDEAFRTYLNDMAESLLPLSNPQVAKLYRLMHFDIRVYLPDLLLMLLDQLTMAHTIEGRVPYLDLNLLSASLSLAPELHADGLETRKLQRLMAKGQLDERTFSAKKQGFSGPVRDWISNNQAAFLERVMSVREVPALEKLNVEAICDASKRDKNPFWYDEVFSLYCLSTWYHSKPR